MSPLTDPWGAACIAAATQNSARGFATTSTIKKKEPEPELELERESSQGPIPTGGEDSGTAAAPHAASSQSVPSTATNASPSSRRAANDGTPVSSAASDWDASEEKRAHDAEHALAERVRAASEKELSKAWKVIEYERRVSSNLTEFSWNDPTNVVSDGLQGRHSAPAGEGQAWADLRCATLSREIALLN